MPEPLFSCRSTITASNAADASSAIALLGVSAQAFTFSSPDASIASTRLRRINGESSISNTLSGRFCASPVSSAIVCWPTAGILLLDQPVLDGVIREIGIVRETHFFEHARAISTDRLHR